MKEYLLKKKIGSSRPTVNVFHATDPENNDFALKIMLAAEDDEEIRRHFQREVEALQRISPHPNVVSIHDSGYRKENFKTEFASTDHCYGFFIAQDFIDGISLKEAISQNKLPPDEGARISILLGIAQGIAHAHLCGVMHRDIKPQNILLTEKNGVWNPVVIDFGISKIQSSIPSPFTLRGALTREWAAPEYINNHTYTQASDVFSFGLVAACVLAGKNLRYNAEHRDLDTVSREFELLNGLSQTIQGVLRDCLQCQPELRIQSFAVVIEGLRRCSASVAPEIHAIVVKQGTIKGYSGMPGKEHEFVESDLRGGPVYLDVYDHKGSKAYQVLGKQFGYHLVPDPTHPTRAFLVVSGKRFDPAISRMLKTRMLSVVAEWDIYPKSENVPEGASIANLTKVIQDHHDKSLLRRHQVERLRRKAHLWKDLLSIESELIKQAPKALGIKYNEVEIPGSEIIIFKGGQLFGSDFEYDELIAVETTEDSFPRLGKVKMFNPREGILAVSRTPGSGIKNIPKNGRLRLDVGAELNPNIRASQAISRVARLDCPEALQKMLTEPDRIINVPDSSVNILDTDLSESKQSAIRRALGAKEYLLVQGPPGTGKTRFIAALVRQITMCWQNQRVLVSSQSNVALDNALEEISNHSAPNEIGIARIGDPSKISDKIQGLQLGTQAKTWAETIIIRLDALIAEYNREVETEGAKAPAYSKAKEMREYAKEETQWREFLEAKSLEIKQKTSFFQTKVLGWKTELSRDLDNLAPDPASIHELLRKHDQQFNELKQQADLGLELDSLAKELKESESILAEYRKRKQEARNAIESMLGIKLSAEAAEESITSQIKEIESHLEKGVKEKSEQLALLRQWSSKLAAFEPSLVEDLLAYGITVVGATCIGSGDARLQSRSFDWVIIDEAARANPGELILPMLRGNRYILVGDQQQLPPFVNVAALKSARTKLTPRYSKEQITEATEKSLFEDLYDLSSESAKTRIVEQYRMSKPIGQMISTLFYKGELQNSPAPDPTGPYLVAQYPLLWIDTSESQERGESASPSFENRFEAGIVHRIIAAGLKSSAIQNDDEVAVLAPYRGQARLLQNTLSSIGIKNLAVSTIDNFQGRQADYVIYSCVRSNPSRRIGFLEDVRRLTVALSRAKRQLILIGDITTLNTTLPDNRRNVFSDLAWYFNKQEQCKIIPASQT